MEIWKLIPSISGCYEASSLGRIRRAKPAKGTIVGKILKPQLGRNGYYQIALSQGGQRKNFMVARLVCEAFNGPPIKGQDVNHKDFNRLNNVPENLEWLSRQDNILYTRDAGRCNNVMTDSRKRNISASQKQRYVERPESFAKGEKHWNAKVSDETLLQAFSLRRDNPKLTIADIARKLGINYQITYDVLTGRKRKYLNFCSAVESGYVSERTENLIL